MAQSFLLGENFVSKIRSTIDRVDGTPLPGAGGTKRPAILEDNPQQGSKAFRIGTFDGSWNKGTSKTVTLAGAQNATVTATNLFADFGEDGQTEQDCAVAKAGGSWYLVEAGPTRECVELSRVEPSGNLTLVSSISTQGAKFVQSFSGSVVTGVECVDGSLKVTLEPLSDLAVTADFSDAVRAVNTTVTLDSIANITTQNYTLPKQGNCE